MLDIPSLERRWLKYKIKSYMPHFLIFTMFISMIVVIAVVFVSKKSDLKPVETKKPIVMVKSLPKNSHEDTMILEPSMQFIQSISSDTLNPQSVNEPIKPIEVKTTIKLKTPSVTIPAQSVSITTPKASITMPPVASPPNSTAIKRDSSAFDIHEIEERFKVNSNPHLGVYIARYHYEHGNYSEAYNYALKTNSINSTMEESWLIFAKSLIKLGKNDQAKKTLQLYISQSNSENAKNLLNAIEQGSIK